MTPSEIRWREKYSDREEKKERERSREGLEEGVCVREEDCRSAKQLGVVGWGRCVFMVRGESRDHFERVCS